MITYYTKEGKFKTNDCFDVSSLELHRENGPAYLDDTALEEWRINGKLHRENGPAIIYYYKKCAEEWWVKGKRHRTNGPAVILSSTSKEWWVNGKRHRVDGPAIVRLNNKIYYYYLNGNKLDTKKIDNWIKENNINLKRKEHQVLFLLKFGW